MALLGILIDKLHEFYIIVFNIRGRNFVIKYKKKQAYISYGKVSKGFLEDCNKLCMELKLNNALIIGYFDNRMKLHFSHQINKKDYQKFRNIWHVNL